MKLHNRISTILIIFSSAILLSFILGSCGLLDSKENSSSGNLNGSVITSDTGDGINNARIRVFEADSMAAETFTDESGEFNFQNLEPGEKKVQLTLPKGFLFMDAPEKTITIDGNLSIEFLQNRSEKLPKQLLLEV